MAKWGLCWMTADPKLGTWTEKGWMFAPKQRARVAGVHLANTHKERVFITGRGANLPDFTLKLGNLI